VKAFHTRGMRTLVRRGGKGRVLDLEIQRVRCFCTLAQGNGWLPLLKTGRGDCALIVGHSDRTRFRSATSAATLWTARATSARACKHSQMLILLPMAFGARRIAPHGLRTGSLRPIASSPTRVAVVRHSKFAYSIYHTHYLLNYPHVEKAPYRLASQLVHRTSRAS